MNKNILKYFVKTIIFGVTSVSLLFVMISMGISIYEIFSGKVSEEEFMILDEISQKIKEGEYPLEELTENDVSISISRDEVNNRYNLELAKRVATENIYFDDDANIIYIEKQDNSIVIGIIGIGLIFLFGVMTFFFLVYDTMKDVTSLIFEIRMKISEFRKGSYR